MAGQTVSAPQSSGNAPAVAQQQRTPAMAKKLLVDKLQGESMRQAIQAVLPSVMNPDRFLSMAIAAAKLAAASPNVLPESILISVYNAAKLGLEIDSMQGHAYLVPFGRFCQLIPGYKGLVHLARQNGLKDIRAYALYEADVYEETHDETGDHFKYIPERGRDRGDIIGVITLYKMKGDTKTRFHRVHIEKIEQVEMGAKARGGAVWKTHREDMILKTGIRQTLKLLDLSGDVGRVIAQDEQVEAGKMAQDIPADLMDAGIIDAQYEDVVAEQAAIEKDISNKPVVEPPKAKAKASTKQEPEPAGPPSPAEAKQPADPELEKYRNSLTDLAAAANVEVHIELLSKFKYKTIGSIPADKRSEVMEHFKALAEAA